jgi:CheY-like chemotaxis protein/Tfp pilus assembly protein PilZ
MQDSVKKLLIVDDDASLRQVLKTDFTRRGYEVMEACNGAEALERLVENMVDLIISDVRMPKVDGVELLHEVRKRYGDLPVFMFITGFSELSLDQAYAQGASALFPKPFNRKNFLEAITWALLPLEDRNQEPLARLSTDFEIDFTLSTSGQSVSGRMLNIGNGGMFVSTDFALPKVGDSLDFTLLFKQDAPLQLKGQGVIRWFRSEPAPGRPSGYGVEFLKLDRNCTPEVIKIIDAFQPLS